MKLTVKLNIRHAQTLTLRNSVLLVSTQPAREALLGRPLLEQLGLDTKATLAAACDRHGGEIDLYNIPEQHEYREGTIGRVMADVQDGIYHSNRAMDSDDEHEPEWLDLGEDTEEESRRHSRRCWMRQTAMDFLKAEPRSLGICFTNIATFSVLAWETTLQHSSNPWRLFQDQTANRSNANPDLTVQTKGTSSNPILQSCCEYGMIFPNNRAQWLSPPLIVPKKGPAKFRLTFRPASG